MTPDLTEADKERFAAYRERLADVDRAPPPDRERITEFTPLDPMLAEPFSGDLAALDESEWIAERKFDGTRILLEKFDGEVRLYTRRKVERAETLPAITAAAAALPDGLILDGEAAYVDDAGNTHFIPIHHAAEKLRERDLEERLYAFDVLVQDREWVGTEPLLDRRARLEEVVPDDGDTITVVAYEESDFPGFFDRVVARGAEGIVLKRTTSLYRPGTRSSNWRKVKHFTEVDALAVGYTEGEGERADTFGALVLSDGERHIGNVGSGFSDAELRAITASFAEPGAIPIDRSAVHVPFTPVEPFVVRVKFQERTDDGHLRAPVFLDRRPDHPPEDVRPVAEQLPDHRT